MLWAFSIWLESVAILPQLFMLQRTGEAETITTHYLFALGAYRAFYIPNWVYRYFAEKHHRDPIAVVAGILQTILYSDFFWIYYTRLVRATVVRAHHTTLVAPSPAPRSDNFFRLRSFAMPFTGSFKARSLRCPSEPGPWIVLWARAQSGHDGLVIVCLCVFRLWLLRSGLCHSSSGGGGGYGYSYFIQANDHLPSFAIFASVLSATFALHSLSLSLSLSRV